MKNRLTRPLVCALGAAALLAGCSPNAPSSPSTPAAGTTPAAVATAEVVGTATPASALTPSATGTPAATVSGTATPSVSGTPTAGGNVPTVEGVKITVTKPGSGAPLTAGTNGSFHYTGWLEGFESDKKFDSSKDRGAPFEFVVGQGMVIPGWDQGLIGMQPGETRRLEISPEQGYGASGAGSQIPPNSTLFFEVDYLGPKS